MHLTDRIVYNNLIYHLSKEKTVVLNLINGRRKILKNEELIMLLACHEAQESGRNLSVEENAFLSGLISEKQILTNSLIEEYNRALSIEEVQALENISVRDLTFNLTHSCIFSCGYCYQNHYKHIKKYDGYMTVDHVEYICKYLSNPFFNIKDFENISISGGEPLQSENIPVIQDIMNRFTANNKILFTNGINILSFQRYIDYKWFDEVQVSLDGDNATIPVVNNYNSGDAFNTIADGIKLLTELGVKVTVSVMLTEHLMDKLGSFVDALLSNEIVTGPLIEIRFSCPRDYFGTFSVDESIITWHDVIENRKRINATIAPLGCAMGILPEIADISFLLRRDFNRRDTPRIKRCDFNKSLPLVFEPNGEVHWCMCLGNDCGQIGDYFANSIKKDSILKLLNRNIYTISQCRNCSLRFICAGGCSLGCVGRNKQIISPSCGVFDQKIFWDNLEELV